MRKPHGFPRFHPRLVIMAKNPVMGRVKTRLASLSGNSRATQFMRTNLHMTIRRIGNDPRWQTLISVAPDAALHSRLFPHACARMAQGSGNLGQRMMRATRAAPPGPVILIGADIPGIAASDIACAFHALNSADAVLGPAGDGGYWLIGFASRWRKRAVLRGVRWSTQHAMADTRGALSGCYIAYTTAKDDVDDAGDLERLGSLAARLII